jgi:hypothetical protein
MRIFHAIYCRSWLAAGWVGAIVAGLMLLCDPAGWASTASSAGDDAPAFTRQGEKIEVSLIPRAKSTIVRIGFGTTGGTLVDVTATPFEEVARSAVDEKDFKSGVFVIQVADVAVGGKAKISVTSDFFSASTEYWVFNDHQAVPWTRVDIKNKAHGNLVQELILTVADGGPLDADHTADGQITVMGGPWDSFWGYALGTLFIRFFGIFLVLSVLMVGMLVSGKIFETLEARRNRPARAPLRVVSAMAEDESGTPSTGDAPAPAADKIAALSLALHLHAARLRAQAVKRLDAPAAAAWIQQGRQRAMGARCVSLRNRKP